MAELADEFRNTTIFLYKLTCDNGGAPCVYRGVLSLSICKPQIRMDAQVGDWIVGFGGRSVPALMGRLIYVAEVTKLEQNGDYYIKEQYRGRSDRIYRRVGSEFEYIEGSRYHDKDDLEHDLGSSPSYERARTLISNHFSYFGGNHAPERAPSIDTVRDIYDRLPRNFRKNLQETDRRRLELFISDAFDRFGRGAHGRPTDSDTSAKCNNCEDDLIAIPPKLES